MIQYINWALWTYTLSAWIFSRKKMGALVRYGGADFLFSCCFEMYLNYWNDELWLPTWVKHSRTERKATNKQSIIKARLSVLWLWLVIIFLLFLLLHKTCSYIALNLAYLYQILWKPAIFDCFYLHYPNYLYTLYISVNGLNFKQESVNLFPRMLLTYLNEQGNLLTHFRLLYLVCT